MDLSHYCINIVLKFLDEDTKNKNSTREGPKKKECFRFYQHINVPENLSLYAIKEYFETTYLFPTITSLSFTI